MPSMEGSPPPPPPKPTRFPSYSSDSEGSLLQGRRRLPGRNACRAARPPRSLSAEALLSARGLGARASSARVEAVEFGQAAPGPLASRPGRLVVRVGCVSCQRVQGQPAMRIHTRTHARAHTRTLTRKRTRTHQHTRLRTHARARTHTHTLTALASGPDPGARSAASRRASRSAAGDSAKPRRVGRKPESLGAAKDSAPSRGSAGVNRIARRPRRLSEIQ